MDEVKLPSEAVIALFLQNAKKREIKQVCLKYQMSW